MGLVHTGETAFDKEMAKHEQFRTRYVGDDNQPGNPYQFRPFPAMLYKAFRREGTGKIECGDPRSAYGLSEAEQFDRQCQRVVTSDAERARALEEGWRSSPAEAIAHLLALETEVATAAAEVNFAASRMRSTAQEELTALQAVTDGHVTDVPRTFNKKKPVPAE